MRMAIDGATFRAVSLPVFAGLLVRAIPVATSDFPLNDGGLFYAMTRDLQHANFLLPATSSYNGLGIPFAYPPLGFYLAAITSGLGIGLIDVFRFLPLVIATLTIPVGYLLAREILVSRFQALLATWAFAFLPRAYDWLIAGGGVTRSLGMLMASLTILAGIRFYKTGGKRPAAGLALFAALTALSHPEAALFAAVSLVLILLAYARTWRAARDSALLAVVAGIIASPWWLTVIATHGAEPFLSGGQTGADLGSTFQRLATFSFTDEPYLTFLAVLGLIGLVRQVAVRRYLLPAWILVAFVVDQRAAATYLMVPLAMLVAIAVDEVLLASVAGYTREAAPGPVWPPIATLDRFARILLSVGLLMGVVGATKASAVLGSPLRSLSQGDRAAMSWIASSVPSTAEFLVVSGSPWYLDVNAEWFPVLTNHRSLATVQGYEWLGKGAWDRQAARDADLQLCVFASADCVDRWTRAEGATDAWVFIPKDTIASFAPADDCCEAIRDSLTASPNYMVVYNGPGGTVFKPRT